MNSFEGSTERAADDAARSRLLRNRTLVARKSVVSCENLLTVVQSAILRTIVHVPDALMQQ